MDEENRMELRDEKVYPDERVLRNILGNSFDAYTGLLNLFEEKGMSWEWRFYRDGKAWLCKVQIKKRTILWMSAWRGYLQATAYFPLKYLDQLNQVDIDPELMRKFGETKNVGKSRPFTFKVKDELILGDLEKVINLKISCK